VRAPGLSHPVRARAHGLAAHYFFVPVPSAATLPPRICRCAALRCAALRCAALLCFVFRLMAGGRTALPASLCVGAGGLV
jgi:hypothetical protein